MTCYEVVDMSPRLLPVGVEAQLMLGSFAHAVHHVVDTLGLFAFDAHYRNDATGTPAVLLKHVGRNKRSALRRILRKCVIGKRRSAGLPYCAL